jgi:hypothetical protein
MTAILLQRGSNNNTRGDRMSIDETIGWSSANESCLVCGKAVNQGTRAARIRWGNIFISFCCPLCVETYLKEPEPFREKAAKVEYYRTLWESVNAHPSAESPLGE